MDLESGKVLQETSVDSKYFGEGITLLDQRIVELTWQVARGFVYDRNTFQQIRDFRLSRRRMGTHQRRPSDLHERRHGANSMLESRDASGNSPFHGS